MRTHGRWPTWRCGARRSTGRWSRRLLLLAWFCPGLCAQARVALAPADTESGYIARLLLNEAAFPGEKGWMSEGDSKAAMTQILWVLHSRLVHVPPGYQQEHVAAVRSQSIIDLITAGGEKGQCDGFYRDASGRPAAVPRVHDRLDYLTGIANRGEPGRFARLLLYGQGLADAYVEGGIEQADRFANLNQVRGVRVTGRAYSWMTDRDYYHPGGHFIRIPNDQQGMLAGNRFFTLKAL